MVSSDHDTSTKWASHHQLLSFLATNPPKKWHVTYEWPRFEIIMACYFRIIRIFIYCAAGRKKVDSEQVWVRVTSESCQSHVRVMPTELLNVLLKPVHLQLSCVRRRSK